MTSKKSYILAGAVALGVTAWMLSDNIFGSAPTAEAEIESAEDAAKKTRNLSCRLSLSKTSQSPKLCVPTALVRPNLW